MNGVTVDVSAPSRLHFGMLSAHGAGPRQYGGVGVMIASPRVRLRIRPAARLEVTGPLAERARRVALAAAAALLNGPAETRAPGRVECRIEILEAPPEHVGLGTGTQLSMAVVAGLNALLGRAPLDAVELARCAGRGERSAIGLHGFVRGGLLFEAGKATVDAVSPLVQRVAMPVDWRFVLVRPRDGRGLFGDAERRAFAQIPPVPAEQTASLRREALEHLLPAAAAGRFDEFSDSLYRFGYLAGQSFATVQGGSFAGPRLTALVRWIRDMGIRGVGQSSWGPTLFALLPDVPSATEFIQRLGRRDTEVDFVTAPADNQGVGISSAREA